ncbi:2-succinyl-5-enolpyruvyl-6-hydroxy-3-cyclohexene-1-carboxylic-acid synthase [Desulfotalea psychrophila]|uniref:2-succinyl-5-enolpyruvyl-6-hydroxy-3-cyclohexene-1-carboxylate synthase n=1 Tax=Desulfotalea psychrophila (strain LSv54 / DSM 12343) TaxID=177439 RepID=MEND_DESPS|nr:2-succinyl-5-enolpyruvyl-6-hydroxy-3-cyclohexene-1-carboxylic-acid synthase [Desulfotalea psychrophila]Q6ARP3.1 RecName: Full=2-succinyl-5-enolpyruvyl-6-hydroxy-3-cyclohexene-1-carboxylate synthase; Short=SEPHCHC synthase; AltName: Full=Menaquinone biosynthesis protein MenD [Desulfotalea psychrophila LSv54]CAG34982.1 related to menaquinone biosynthesis protein (MenD) [Desulfotalea psychrophila LSv54]
MRAKQHISDLAHHCIAHGMRHLVISPGSRNAPLIRAFAASSQIECLSIVDERSAAFVALGLATELQAPVGVLCTSGTALLNYGPAIAEAYYLRAPLIVLSADRPARLVGQQDSQTICQDNLFANIVKGSYSLPEEPETVAELELSARVIAQAFSTALSPCFGPVHINIPLDEPLYGGELMAESLIALSPLQLAEPKGMSPALWQEVESAWRGAKRRMIVCGQGVADAELQALLARFAPDKTVTIIAENTANIVGPWLVDRPDAVLLACDEASRSLLAPDCLISFGGHLVAKHIKLLLREFKPAFHFRLDPAQMGIDTYQCLSAELDLAPTTFFRRLAQQVEPAAGFRDLWALPEGVAENQDDEFLVLKRLLGQLPAGSIAHLGNSMSVRHAQKLASRADLLYHSNRGVAGIDGCLSTAVGVALATDQLVLCCLGDLSFVYDSNALWNRNLPSNLRIVILNNQGGDIFRRLKGPSVSPGYQDFFVAHHPVQIGKMIEAYGVAYRRCLASEIDGFSEEFLGLQDGPLVLEVFVDPTKRD